MSLICSSFFASTKLAGLTELIFISTGSLSLAISIRNDHIFYLFIANSYLALYTVTPMAIVSDNKIIATAVLTTHTISSKCSYVLKLKFYSIGGPLVLIVFILLIYA